MYQNIRDPITHENVLEIPRKLRITLKVENKLWCYNIVSLHRWTLLRNIDPSTNIPFTTKQTRKIRKRYKRVVFHEELIGRISPVKTRATIRRDLHPESSYQRFQDRLDFLRVNNPEIWQLETPDEIHWRILAYIMSTKLAMWCFYLLDSYIRDRCKRALMNPDVYQRVLLHLSSIYGPDSTNLLENMLHDLYLEEW
jgi:hypothetical protein